MLIGINVGAITMDRLLASIKFFDELDATVSKNCEKEKKTYVAYENKDFFHNRNKFVCTVPAASSTGLLKLKEESKGISDEVHEQLFPESPVE